MKYVMYKGETYEQSCSDGACINAKAGKIVRGFLIADVKGNVFILTPTVNYGDPDFGNMLQYFYSFKVKPESVKKVGSIKDIDKFALDEH